MPESDYQFGGFTSPRYTPTPDEFFDELLAPGRLTEGELRVTLYIIRHTFGWKKDQDAISLSQMTDGIVRKDGTRVDWGAGVSRATAVRAVQGLERKGIIVAARSHSAARGNETTTYRLRMAGEALPVAPPPGAPPPDPSLTMIPGESQPTDPSLMVKPGEVQPSDPSLTMIPGESQDETRGVSSRDQGSPTMQLALVSPQNPQKTTEQETTRQEIPDSNPAPRFLNGDRYSGPHSPWIAGVLEDYSRELGDAPHWPANSTQAHRLWQASGLDEAVFIEQVHLAFKRTRTAQGRQGTGLIANRMAYFFIVLRDVLGLAAA